MHFPEWVAQGLGNNECRSEEGFMGSIGVGAPILKQSAMVKGGCSLYHISFCCSHMAEKIFQQFLE